MYVITGYFNTSFEPMVQIENWNLLFLWFNHYLFFFLLIHYLFAHRIIIIDLKMILLPLLILELRIRR
jgi:hypothetical protein